MKIAKRIFFLLILVVLFTACNRQAIPSNSAKGIEIIVFTWDWPMEANVPPIHIWKDGHAIWVTWENENVAPPDDYYHIYETFLSYDEMFNVQNTLRDSGFWEDEQQEAVFTNASNFVIWASLSDVEKSVGVSHAKYETTVSSLREILEASPKKVEYFPKEAYLFARPVVDYSGRTSERDYLWPDKEIMFEFSQASQGIYVDGRVLLSIWDAIQQNDFRIISHNKAYYYELKIPGVSCVISNDPGDPYLCNMYTAETR